MLKPEYKEIKPSSKLYHELKMLVCNRKISMRNVRNLNVSMQISPDLLQCAPIVSCWNAKKKCYKIIDGQHRYKAALMLGNPIWVIIVDPKLNSGRPDVSVPASKEDEFRQYEFSIDNLDEFVGFEIKIVISGTNEAYPPRFKDLRVIALA